MMSEAMTTLRKEIEELIRIKSEFIKSDDGKPHSSVISALESVDIRGIINGKTIKRKIEIEGEWPVYSSGRKHAEGDSEISFYGIKVSSNQCSVELVTLSEDEIEDYATSYRYFIGKYFGFTKGVFLQIKEHKRKTL